MSLFSSPRQNANVLRVSSAALSLMLLGGTIAIRAHAGAEKYVLVYKAKAGQTKKVKGVAQFNLDAGGQKVTLDYTATDLSTYTVVDGKTGNITVESKTIEQELAFNGEKVPPPEDGKEDITTISFKPTGELISYKDNDDKPKEGEDDHFGERAYLATTPIFPAKELGVGDKWVHEYKADEALGTKEGKAEFELESFEKVGGIDCVKIKMTFTESGSDALTSKGTVWVERSSGDKINSDMSLEGVPFEGMIASGTVKEERTEGSPLSGDAVAPPKADDPKKDDKKPDAQAKPDEKKPEEKKPEPKKDKTIDEIVKDYEKIPGVVTLYRKKEPTKDTIYMELTDEQLGKLLMLEVTASTGTADQIVAGDPINDIMFKFDKNSEDKILMVVPNYTFQASSPELKKAMRQSFADGYLASYKIEAKQAERKSYLIDVSDLFRGDFAQISAAMAGGAGPLGLGGGGGGFSLDRDKTYIDTLKNFPDNLMVKTHYHFQRGGRPAEGSLADGRSAPIDVTYNLFVLPTDSGYVPRLSDPRVGYFMNEYMSFDNDGTEDPLVRYIYRWDLRKKDPTAAVSEPIKPIVFWLDNATPKEYRDAVRDGLLVWNKAFAKIGFKDVVVVKQMPDNPDPNDANTPSDIADMRFNTVRWVLSPEDAYAVARFRVNPLTGQILNASITVDAGIVRSFKLERNSIVDPAAAFERGAGMDFDAILAAGKGPLSAATAQKLQMASDMDKLGKIDAESLFKSGPSQYLCEFGGTEFRRNSWFGYKAMSLLGDTNLAAGKTNPLINEKDYARQIIVETVGHEMGHVMGLRHNFTGSTQFTLEELKDAKRVKEYGLGASIMDYNAFNISALKQPGVPFFAQTIGVYDVWAIEYGYKTFPNVKTSQDELPSLKQIARRSGEPGHAYQSDEQRIIGFDPLVTYYDLTSDPLAYYQKKMQVCKALLVNLDQRLPKNGQSYYEFTRAFQELLATYASAAGVASRHIGGLNVRGNFKGDMNEKAPLLPVDVKKQKAALQMLNDYIFSPTAFNFPERYYTHLTMDPNAPDFGGDFPIQDQFANLQRSALNRIFAPAVLARVANNEFKQGGDPARSLTLPTMFNSVGGNIWAELATKKSVPSLRRQLQRSYLDKMIEMAIRVGGPEDARMLAWNQLKTLQTKIKVAQTATPTLDEYTRVHYADSLNKIQRTLNAQVTLGGSAPAPQQNLLQMLLGGKQ